MVEIDLSGKRASSWASPIAHSIAWGIAQMLDKAGAKLAVTYQNERLEPKVRELAEGLGEPLILPLDVTDDAADRSAVQRADGQIRTTRFLGSRGRFAPREDLTRDFVETSCQGYAIAEDVSVVFAGRTVQRGAAVDERSGRRQHRYADVLRRGESRARATTSWAWPRRRWRRRCGTWPTTWGPENIRVNAISAGPMRTLAAARRAGLHGYAEVPRRQGAAEAAGGHGGAGGHGAVFVQPLEHRHYRRSHSRRRRLQHSRNVTFRFQHFPAREGVGGFPDNAVALAPARGPVGGRP